MLARCDDPHGHMAELEQLRQRAAELEQINTSLQRRAVEQAAAYRALEMELHTSRTLAQRLLEQSPVAICAQDSHGRMLLFNRYAAATLRLDPDRDIGATEEELLPTAMLADWRAQRQQVQETGQALQAEAVLPHADGDHTYTTIRFPLYNEQGEIDAVGCIASDMSERKRNEELLHASEQKFRRFFEASWDSMVLVDQQGTIIEWNQGSERTFGLTRQEAIGRLVWEVQLQLAPAALRSPDLYHRARTTTLELLRTGQGKWIDRWLGQDVLRPDGSQRKVHSLAFPIHTDVGILLGSIARDVTELSQTEAQRRIFFKLAENAPDAISVASLEGIITYANPACRAMLGWGDDLIGMSVIDLSAESPEYLKHLLQQVGVQGGWRGILICKRQDGSTFTGELAALNICDEAGQPQAVAAIIRDVTQQQRLEEALRSQVSFTRLITTISTRFITIETEEIAEEIFAALCTVGRFIAADCGCVGLLPESGTTMQLPYWWHRG